MDIHAATDVAVAVGYQLLCQ